MCTHNKLNRLCCLCVSKKVEPFEQIGLDIPLLEPCGLAPLLGCWTGFIREGSIFWRRTKFDLNAAHPRRVSMTSCVQRSFVSSFYTALYPTESVAQASTGGAMLLKCLFLHGADRRAASERRHSGSDSAHLCLVKSGVKSLQCWCLIDDMFTEPVLMQRLVRNQCFTTLSV